MEPRILLRAQLGAESSRLIGRTKSYHRSHELSRKWILLPDDRRRRCRNANSGRSRWLGGRQDLLFRLPGWNDPPTRAASRSIVRFANRARSRVWRRRARSSAPYRRRARDDAPFPLRSEAYSPCCPGRSHRCSSLHRDCNKRPQEMKARERLWHEGLELLSRQRRSAKKCSSAKESRRRKRHWCWLGTGQRWCR